MIYIDNLLIGETDEESKNEDCYFAFTNTIWGKPKEIAKTAMSVTKFTDILSKILCARKTLFINCAHVPKPEPTFFGSSKVLLYYCFININYIL